MKKDRSLAEAREWVREHSRRGVDCPCCGQFAKVYKRKITASMVHTMVEILVRQKGWDDWPIHDWIYLPDIPQKARDFSTVAFFLLAEEKPDSRDDGGRVGYWRITGHGEQFLLGHVEVHKYALVYNGEVLGYEGESTGVEDVAPEFNLKELMET